MYPPLPLLYKNVERKIIWKIVVGSSFPKRSAVLKNASEQNWRRLQGEVYEGLS